MTNESDAQLVEFLATIQSLGWTRSMVIINTLGTVAGALVGFVALAIALLALFS